jgi:hypothetical protein
MEKRLIKTLVKGDHKLGKDTYVLGRIVGAMAVMCKEDPAMGLELGRGYCKNGDRIIVTETTDEKYETFIRVIESWYTGLCIFNYVE